MTDFCLGPDAIIDITRQVHLMDRMCERAGIPAHQLGRPILGSGSTRGCDAWAAP